jgi:hypothetical protein
MTNHLLIAVAIGLAVVIGLLLLLPVARLLFGGKSAARRSLFRIFIKDLRGKIVATQLREFKLENSLAFHVNVKHVPELERQIVELEPFLGSGRRQKMDAAFAAYKALAQAGDDNKNEPVKAQMLSLLDKITRCAR